VDLVVVEVDQYRFDQAIISSIPEASRSERAAHLQVSQVEYLFAVDPLHRKRDPTLKFNLVCLGMKLAKVATCFLQVASEMVRVAR
jgi:hypothetical protein